MLEASGPLLPPLLYVLVLEPQFQKLEQLRGIAFKMGLGRAVSTYMDDVTVMVSDVSEVQRSPSS